MWGEAQELAPSLDPLSELPMPAEAHCEAHDGAHSKAHGEAHGGVHSQAHGGAHDGAHVKTLSSVFALEDRHSPLLHNVKDHISF